MRELGALSKDTFFFYHCGPSVVLHTDETGQGINTPTKKTTTVFKRGIKRIHVYEHYLF